MNEKFLAEIKRHEVFKAKPYRDTKGVLTIGYGLNLDDGISEPLATKLLVWILEERRVTLSKTLPFWNVLTMARQEVFLNMAFNLGMPRFMKFKKMLSAAAIGDVVGVCNEMQDSKWYREDVGYRAIELVKKYLEG